VKNYFHIHKWEIIDVSHYQLSTKQDARSIAAQVKKNFKQKDSNDQSMLLNLELHGYSIVLKKCIKCKELLTEVTPGNSTALLSNNDKDKE